MSENQNTASVATTPEGREIIEICDLAGRVDLAACFILAGLSPAQVRKRLLSFHATARGAESPVVRACQRLAAQSRQRLH